MCIRDRNANIFFRHAVDGGQTLTVSSGSGAVDFAGIIGGTTALGDTTINASGTGTIAIAAIGDADDVGAIVGTTAIGNTSTAGITFDGTIYKFGNPAGGSDTVTITATGTGQVIDFTGGAVAVESFGGNAATAGNAITFATGTIDLDNGSNLTINSNGGAITVAAIRGDSSETVTINAVKSSGSASATETISIGAIGNADEIGAITLDGADGITLSGAITTSNAAGSNVDLNGPVIISGAVDIDTDTGGTDGTIDFSSTIVGDGNGATTDNLTIDSGGSTVTFNGTIGVAAPIAAFSVNQDGGDVALSIPQIGTASGNAGTSGITLIGTANTASVTLTAASYEFGGATTITSAGNITASGTNPDICLLYTSDAADE